MPEYIALDNKNGSKFQVQVVSLREKAKSIYDFFGLEVGNKALLDEASNYLNQTIESHDIDLMLKVLWQNEINFIDLWEAIACIAPENKQLYFVTHSQSGRVDIPTP